MKNKVIKFFVAIIISLSCISLLNNSYAGDACRVGVNVEPKNPQPGDEITIDLSLEYIHDPVSEINFCIDYDLEKFEYLGATATDFWDIKLVGETFCVESKNSEATTDTGKVATIRLKVKDNAVASTNTIKVTKIQAATDDGFSVDLEDKEDKITIQQNNDTPNENTSGGNTNTSEVDNNTPGGNTSNSDGSPIENTNSGRSSDSIDESKIVTINGNSSGAESAKGSDTSTTTKTLPKTGRSTIITIALTLATLGIAFSYVLYRKYKNI